MKVRPLFVAIAAATVVTSANAQLLGQSDPLGPVDEPLDSAFEQTCSLLDCGEFCPVTLAQFQQCQGRLQTCQNNLNNCEKATCGNNIAESGEQCDGENLQGHTCQTEGFRYGRLGCFGARARATCTFDTSRCTDSRFVDNGDGTVTDNATNLMWEEKVPGGDLIHGVDAIYFWSGNGGGGFGAMGTFISYMNGTTDINVYQTGFAGHTDWRLPTVAELNTIVNGNAPGCGTSTCGSPCVFPDFPGATAAGTYWSSSVVANPRNPQAWVWVVTFCGYGLSDQSSPNSDQYNIYHARAVRTLP